MVQVGGRTVEVVMCNGKRWLGNECLDYRKYREEACQQPLVWDREIYQRGTGLQVIDTVFLDDLDWTGLE